MIFVLGISSFKKFDNKIHFKVMNDMDHRVIGIKNATYVLSMRSTVEISNDRRSEAPRRLRYYYIINRSLFVKRRSFYSTLVLRVFRLQASSSA